MTSAFRLFSKRPRAGLAFGTDFLLAARRGENGMESVRSELPPEVFSISPVTPNFTALANAARLAGEAFEKLGGTSGQGILILPDLAVRAFVLPANGNRSTAAALAKVERRLPYPGNEACLDLWVAPGGGRMLAAAVRRPVLRQYEQLLEAIGCSPSWANGASLARIPAWAREVSGSPGSLPGGVLRAYLQSYRHHYTWVVFHQGELVDVRVRMRTSGELGRMVDDSLRLPDVYDAVGESEIIVSGDGANRLVAEIGERGELHATHSGAEGEPAQLESILGMAMQRSW